MTDRRGQSTEDAAPASHEEAEQNVLQNSALNAPSQDDAATDDDARTPDTSPTGETKDS